MDKSIIYEYKNAESRVQPYAFISYSHADKVKVEHILRILHRNGKRFWYDYGIETGEGWEEEINEHISHSSMFMLFMTNGIELRKEVIRELELAIKKRDEENKDYKVIAVMLERVPIMHIFEGNKKILDFFATVQYVKAYDYGGITLEFERHLLSGAIWQHCMTEDEKKKYSEKGDNETLFDFSDVLFENSYVYPRAFPEKFNGSHGGFYRVKIGETAPNSVYPICMDNQWCPPEFFDNNDFIREGFRNSDLQKWRTQMQQHEIYRALLHHWQVVINRASLYNTYAIAEWYTQDGENKEAFCKMLENGSFVVYLMDDKSPDEKPKYDVREDYFSKWEKLCKEHNIYCIRMSWDDIDGNDEANKFETSTKLATKMQNLFITTANNPYRLKLFGDIVNVSDEPQNRKNWKTVWQDIRCKTVQCDDHESGSYTRNRFYMDFLVKDGTNVSDCILVDDKPFVRELKQIVDFMYTINLPAALHIQPVSSYNTKLWNSVLTEERSFRQMRTISVDELAYSVTTFDPSFLKEMSFCSSDNLSLAAVCKIRELHEWRAYLEAVDSGQKRANLNEIDFYDMELIWNKYRDLLDVCAARFPELGFCKISGSVSLIYSFGNCCLKCVYSQQTLGTVKTRLEGEKYLSDKSRENLTIDYVCGDILASSFSDNCFLEKIRLFEGIILESSQRAYNETLEALRKSCTNVEEK